MIPYNQMNPAATQNLLVWLTDELKRTQAARAPLEESWMRWHTAYRARPDKKRKDFPFVGASNLVIPIIATDVDVVFSMVMALLFGQQNLWSCRATQPEMVEFAMRLQEFLEWAQKNELEMYDATANWLLELVKLGTGVLKQRYVRRMQKVFEFRETDFQTIARQVRLLIKDNPVVNYVPIVDFYIPAGYETIQKAPWCAERLLLSWPELLKRAQDGIYTNLANLGNWNATANLHRVEQSKAPQLFTPTLGDRFELFEFWTDFDIGLDRESCAVVCTIHIPTMTYVRIDYNPFFNQEKPYSAARYQRVEGQFYGIGICEMLDYFQMEVTTTHNQRIDSNTVKTASMFTATEDSGISIDEPFWPGRIIKVASHDSLKALPMGSGIDMSVNYEAVTMDYAQRRTGVSDLLRGLMEPSIGYATATTNVNQLREGKKRLDQTMREVRTCLSETGTRVAELYQQFNQGGKPFLAMGQKDGQQVAMFLRFPLQLVRMGVAIDITATSAQYNKEVEIRTNTIIMQQLLVPFYGQLLQALQLIINPMVPPPIRNVASQMAQGGVLLMRRILDSYGLQDADRLVPDLQEALYGNQQGLDSLYGLLGGPPGVAATGIPQPGMAAPVPGYGGAAGPGLSGPPGGGYQLGPGAGLQGPVAGNGARVGLAAFAA